MTEQDNPNRGQIRCEIVSDHTGKDALHHPRSSCFSFVSGLR
jgi:hypothetical protein